MKNKLLLTILGLCITLPCFADGGIPLWITNTPTVLALLGFFPFGDMTQIAFSILFFLSVFVTVFSFLIGVTLVEVFVARFILKNTKIFELSRIIFIANLVSALVGAIIVDAPLFINFSEYINANGIGIFVFGPWTFVPIPVITGILLMNIILLAVSYFVEYIIVKKWLKKDYETKKIKNAVLLANIATYSLSILLYLPFIPQEYQTIINETNYKVKYSSENLKKIEDLKLITPLVISQPLSEKECESKRKELGITTSCVDKDDWAGAVNTCGGVDYMLTDTQIKELFANILINNENKYNMEMLKKYNLDKSVFENAVKTLKKSDEFKKHNYEQYREIGPRDICIYTNISPHSSMYTRAEVCGMGGRLGYYTKFTLCSKNKTIINDRKPTIKDYRLHFLHN